MQSLSYSHSVKTSRKVAEARPLCGTIRYRRCPIIVSIATTIFHWTMIRSDELTYQEHCHISDQIAEMGFCFLHRRKSLQMINSHLRNVKITHYSVYKRRWYAEAQYLVECPLPSRSHSTPDERNHERVTRVLVLCKCMQGIRSLERKTPA